MNEWTNEKTIYIYQTVGNLLFFFPAKFCVFSLFYAKSWISLTVSQLFAELRSTRPIWKTVREKKNMKKIKQLPGRGLCAEAIFY
jgi:hypothetical protein